MKKYLIGAAVGILLSLGIQALATSLMQPIVFTDSSTFADWFKSSVNIMSQLRVMKGYPDGSFKPGNSVNRAELAVILDQYTQNVVDPRVSAAAGGVDLKLNSYLPMFKGLTLSPIKVEPNDGVSLAQAGLFKLNAQPDLNGFSKASGNLWGIENYSSSTWEEYDEMNDSKLYQKTYYLHDKEENVWYGPFYKSDIERPD